MLDFDSAQDRLIQAATVPVRSERIPVDQALGRINAQVMYANLDIPPADNSAMDGYAVRHQDVTVDHPLPIQDHIYAGDEPMPLEPGKAIRLFTGSVMPEGADTVVMQEHCTEDNGTVEINRLPPQGANVRLRGEDMANDQSIILQGQRLNSRHQSLLAAQGFTHIDVYPVPKIGILSTGDELVDPGKPLREGQIYNSNTPMLDDLIHELGAETVARRHAPDTIEGIQEALKQLTESCDVVLTVGGVSVGEKDFVKPAIEQMGGQMDLWRVRMKPGRPVTLAQVRRTPVIGLPGNPVSAYAVFVLMVSPLIRRLQGRTQILPTVLYGYLDSSRSFYGQRDEFLRVQATPKSDGRLQLIPHPKQGSAMISSLAWANGLARIPADQEVKNGDIVRYYDFRLWTS